MKRSNIILVIIVICIILIIIMSIVLIVIKEWKRKERLEEREEGGIEYEQVQAKNVEIDTREVIKEIEGVIKDINKIKENIKEYIFINGLVDANKITVKESKMEKNKIKLKVQLDDINNTILLFIIDIETQKMEIIENY